MSRTQHVAERLRDAILRGDYAAGDRLPAERELAEQLGVGRSSVREASKKLEQLGLVEIRHGNGALVRPLQEASLDILRNPVAAQRAARGLFRANQRSLLAGLAPSSRDPEGVDP